MESFLTRKRRRLSDKEEQNGIEEDSTDFKLTLLASLHPEVDQGALLESLLASDGSVEQASSLLLGENYADNSKVRKKSRSSGQQASLATFNIKYDASLRSSKGPLTKRGKTLHLYTPEDIEEHTPCSIIHNFLPSEEADALLRELLVEAPSFTKQIFKLFDRVVSSPHSMW
jgi:hypothetical protein